MTNSFYWSITWKEVWIIRTDALGTEHGWTEFYNIPKFSTHTKRFYSEKELVKIPNSLNLLLFGEKNGEG